MQAGSDDDDEEDQHYSMSTTGYKLVILRLSLFVVGGWLSLFECIHDLRLVSLL